MPHEESLPCHSQERVCHPSPGHPEASRGPTSAPYPIPVGTFNFPLWELSVLRAVKFQCRFRQRPRRVSHDKTLVFACESPFEICQLYDEDFHFLLRRRECGRVINESHEPMQPVRMKEASPAPAQDGPVAGRKDQPTNPPNSEAEARGPGPARSSGQYLTTFGRAGHLRSRWPGGR